MTPRANPGLDPFEGKALLAMHPPKGARVIVCEGAVRSSKTVSTLVMWAEWIRKLPQGEMLMVGVTIDTLIRNLLVPMQTWYGTQRVKYTRSLGFAEIFGRRIFIMGANNIAAVKRVQGMTLVGAYVDEAANMPEPFFDMLDTRLSVPGARMMLTCNPEGPKHWLLTKWLLRARWWVDAEGTRHLNMDTDDLGNVLSIPWYRVTFVLDDNVWLCRTNPEYVANLKRSHVGVFYQRMILSRWVSADGMVYPNFDPTRHALTREQLVNHVTIERVLSAGLDYGQNHKTRGYLLGLGSYPIDASGKPTWRAGTRQVGTRHAVFVLAEFAPDSMTVGEHAALFEQFLAANKGYGDPEWIAVDPAALVMKTELFYRGYQNAMGAHNAVIPGIQTVTALMGTGGLFIVKDECPKLVDMLPAYQWDSKASERGETKVLKENDDECLALGTLVQTETGPRAIETIRPGERVWTRAGLREVDISTATHDGRKVPTYRVELSNGEVVTATGNHPFYLEDGTRRRVDELRYGDKLIAWNPSPIEASPSDATQDAPTSARTSRTASAASKTCTVKSGKASGVRYQTDTTSTTETRTLATTTSATWNASRPSSITPSTRPSAASTHVAKKANATSLSPATPPEPGTPARKAERGTSSMGVPCGATGCPLRAYASSAATPTSAAAPSGSAPTPASQPAAAQAESMTKHGNVSTAADTSGQAGTREPARAGVHVRRVSAGPTVETWNLAVAEHHEYYAGGVLVSNCDALRYSIYTVRHAIRAVIPLAPINEAEPLEQPA